MNRISVIMPKCACDDRDLSIIELNQLFGDKKIDQVLWDVMYDAETNTCSHCQI